MSPRRIDFENISVEQAIELIDVKVEKEANRYIQKWDEENIAIENGRWGPFIRVKRKIVKIPKVDGEKLTAEDLKKMSLEDVKKMIAEQKSAAKK